MKKHSYSLLSISKNVRNAHRKKDCPSKIGAGLVYKKKEKESFVALWIETIFKWIKILITNYRNWDTAGKQR